MFKLLLALILAALVFVYRAVYSGVLDGSEWAVKVRRSAVFAIAHKDTLLFDNGRMTSVRYLSSGYRPSGYDMKQYDESSRWEATLEREDGSVLDWRGVIRGDRMKGTVVWVRPDGSMKEYSFHGKRKS